MPYLWKIPDEYPEELIGEYLREQSPNRFLLRQGKIFTDHNLTPTFRFNGSLEVLEGFDILPNSTMIPLVSERVANLLIAICASDLQFIPATVMVGDEEILGKSLLNALKFISGIDHLHSE